MDERDKFLQEVFERHIDKSYSVLEIGCGNGRRMRDLEAEGYKVEGIDKLQGTAIEDVKEKEYDVIFTMSTFFLIPRENDWVFEKIARMAKKYIITIEGEEEWERIKVVGRNYKEVFEPFGFKEIENRVNVFNQFGVSRVLKRNET